MLRKFLLTEMQTRVRWYITMRWFYLGPLTLAGVIPLYTSSGLSEDFFRQSTVAIVGLALNLVFFFVTLKRYKTKFTYVALSAAQLALDVFLATWIIYLNGGLESRLIIVYAIPIFMSGALLGRKGIYITAAVSGLVYSSLITFDHLGIFHPPNSIFPLVHTDMAYYQRAVIFFSAIFLVLAVIADFVGRLVREREALKEEMQGLAAEKAKTEAILKTMGSALVAIDRAGQITMVNNSFEDLTGWSRKEVVGHHLNDVLPILDSRGHRLGEEERPMPLSSDSGKPDPHVQHIGGYVYVRKDGSTFPFMAYQAPVLLGGRIIGYTTVFDDVTDSQKLDQLKDNFVALISHQLKTPIGEIKGYTENMLAGLGGSLSSKQSEYIEQIQDVADRANKLISNLLDITLAGQGNLSVENKPVKLAAVIDQITAARKQRMDKKGLKLHVKLPDPELRVLGDARKLVEALGNVVDNAISYSKKGTITISVVADEKNIKVYVNDQGAGMEKSTLYALFREKGNDVLSRAPTAEGGTGLGLYLAKQLVGLMGGDIRVVSTSKRGTTICITLPTMKA